MEAFPSLAQAAPAPSATGLQSIVQLNVSGAAPGIRAVIGPDHLPAMASTVLFNSGGGDEFRSPCASADSGSKTANQSTTKTLFDISVNLEFDPFVDITHPLQLWSSH